MDRVNQLVKNLLSKHTGGSEFFDELDNKVKNPDIVSSLLNQMSERFPGSQNIVLSGRFGMFMYGYLTGRVTRHHLLLVSGGLRNGDDVKELACSGAPYELQPYVFIDDSIYKGRTRHAIMCKLNKVGFALGHTFVVYDGMKDRNFSVTSLYRYWDNH